MIQTLRNNDITVRIDSKGAQLLSLCSRCGREYIWNGDASVWKWHAPVLFPCCGNFPDGYSHNGKTLFLPMHGFLRDDEHMSIGDGTFIYRTEGKDFYPFPFEAKTEFIAEGNKLTHRLTIENTGEEPMPYSIGFHTGFRLKNPLLRFSSSEEKLGGNEFRCDDGSLSETVLLTGLKSESIEAESEDGKVIRITSPEFTTLVLWSAKGHASDYVCIEPRIDTVPDGASYPFARILKPSERASLEEIIEIIR